MCSLHLGNVVIILCICRFFWEQRAVFTMHNPDFAPHFISDAQEGSIDSWLWMQAAAWLKLRCIWIKQTGTASINLCVEIKASHTWKAGSPWFPLELGLVAMGVEGAIAWGKKEKTDRKTVSSFHLQYLIMHSLFCLEFKDVVVELLSQFFFKSDCNRSSSCYFMLHVEYLITMIVLTFVRTV